MRPVTKLFALFVASCTVFAVKAVDAQDGLIRSEQFPPVAGRKTGPVSIEEAAAVLSTLRQVPEILTARLHDALDGAVRDRRAALSLQRDVSVAVEAIAAMRREVLEPFRAVRGFPVRELASFERELSGVEELARSVKEDLGSDQGTFIRGDSNGDGTVDMSDAVYTLDYLYLGGAEPDCQAAADANDDEALDLSDAVGTLNTLFVNPTPLPPPNSEAGVDPTPGLGCAVGLEAKAGAAGGGAALRDLGPIKIDRGIRINCYWVCVFVCTPNFCLYYCYSICILR